MLDDRWVQVMRDLSQHNAKVAQFFAQRCDALHCALLRDGLLAGPVVQLVLKQGDALEGVVVHFARHPCAFVFLCGQQALGVLPVQGNDPALIEYEGGTERKQDDA